jgi:hypothetical protein
VRAISHGLTGRIFSRVSLTERFPQPERRTGPKARETAPNGSHPAAPQSNAWEISCFPLDDGDDRAESRRSELNWSEQLEHGKPPARNRLFSARMLRPGIKQLEERPYIQAGKKGPAVTPILPRREFKLL